MAKRKYNRDFRGEKNPFYGKRHTEEANEKNRQAHLGIKQSPETLAKKQAKLKGQKRTPEQIENIKRGIKEYYDRVGRKYVHDHRHEGKEYREWRESVYERDDWTCQSCGKRGGYLEAHHHNSWKNYPDSRFDIDNGITLCRKPCHLEANRKQKLYEKEIQEKD